ncbi:MAG: nucleotidyltransferase family protein, partial [Pseudomonadota bacterium]
VDDLIGHVGKRTDIWLSVSDERDALLETGGGIRQALPMLEGSAILTANSDNLWLGADAFAPLLDRWQEEEMDALLLLVRRENAVAYARQGDFFLGETGHLARRGAAESAPFVFTGAQIIARRAFDGTPAGAFSLNVIWDREPDIGAFANMVDDLIGHIVRVDDGMTDTRLRHPVEGMIQQRAAPHG